jgi:hypothetical protein
MKLPNWKLLRDQAKDLRCRLSLLSDEHHSRHGGVDAMSSHQQRAVTSGKPEEPTMTASFTRTIRQAGLVLAFAVSLSTLSSTSSFAFSAEAQEMCTGDAMRLCGSEIPNISKITACMMAKRASLSSGCRTVMDRDLAAQAKGKVAKN